MQRPWPTTVDELIGSTDGAILRRGPNRWSVGPLVVWQATDGHTDVDGAIQLIERLDGITPFPLPRVRGRVDAWLVTESPAGERADRPDRHAEPGALAHLVGVGLAGLHALAIPVFDQVGGPVGDLVGGPVGDLAERDDRSAEDGWVPIVERCRQAVELGHVDGGHLPAPYDRYRPERLLEMLIESVDADRSSSSTRPPEPPVFCHGRPTLDRFLVDGGRFAGFDGFESVVVADRHLDLAFAHRSVAEVLGAEAVIGLYEGYGADPDLGRLDRAVLASHLLGGAPSPASAEAEAQAQAPAMGDG